jgi:predicted NAD-dependent protein-ADP-ribosyltransferase YbiA (DUF1768 family)
LGTQEELAEAERAAMEAEVDKLKEQILKLRSPNQANALGRCRC